MVHLTISGCYMVCVSLCFIACPIHKLQSYLMFLCCVFKQTDKKPQIHHDIILYIFVSIKTVKTVQRDL